MDAESSEDENAQRPPASPAALYGNLILMLITAFVVIAVVLTRYIDAFKVAPFVGQLPTRQEVVDASVDNAIVCGVAAVMFAVGIGCAIVFHWRRWRWVWLALLVLIVIWGVLTTMSQLSVASTPG